VLSTKGLWELVEERATCTPDLHMLIESGGRRVTFAAFRAAAEEMAAGLQTLGVRSGDVVAWELPTWVDTVVLAAALSRVGAVQVPIVAINRDREVIHCCAESGARFLFTPSTFRGYDFAELGRRVTEAVDGIRHFVVEDQEFPKSDPVRLGAPAPSPAPDVLRWICYTSGTSSFPKGARHTDLPLAAVAGDMAERLGLGEGDRYSLVFPFPHIGGLILLFATLRSGCAQLVDAAFDPVSTVDFLAREGVTHAGTGTAHHLAYLAAQRARPQHKLFASLRCCPGGGAAKPVGLHQDVKQELGGVGVVSSWGLTEAPLLTFGALDDGDEKLASTEGRPLPGVEIRTVNGELQIRAPQLMLGYVDRVEQADAFMDGWFRTGDIGSVDEDGYVVVSGRLKDVIIRNSENVSAKEVEDLLYIHPAIADAAVVGVPDPGTGERVVAVVALAPGRTISLTAVRVHLRAHGLRVQAIPERLEIVDALPRNPSGKVLKQLLREGLAGPSDA
jgi:acyl-CoA synthetase (AMP-forming)/AMP-acid ligase II